MRCREEMEGRQKRSFIVEQFLGTDLYFQNTEFLEDFFFWNISNYSKAAKVVTEHISLLSFSFCSQCGRQAGRQPVKGVNSNTFRPTPVKEQLSMALFAVHFHKCKQIQVAHSSAKYCSIKIRSCKIYTSRTFLLWDSLCLSILQNKSLRAHSLESNASTVLSVLSVIVLKTQLTLRPAISIFQHYNSFYCPTISHASCQDTQMNELPGGKLEYKFTRPLLHHNCLYSYSHSSCSTRCTWKWFVLRKRKKKEKKIKEGVGRFASAL